MKKFVPLLLILLFGCSNIDVKPIKDFSKLDGIPYYVKLQLFRVDFVPDLAIYEKLKKEGKLSYDTIRKQVCIPKNSRLVQGQYIKGPPYQLIPKSFLGYSSITVTSKDGWSGPQLSVETDNTEVIVSALEAVSSLAAFAAETDDAKKTGYDKDLNDKEIAFIGDDICKSQGGDEDKCKEYIKKIQIFAGLQKMCSSFNGTFAEYFLPQGTTQGATHGATLVPIKIIYDTPLQSTN